MCFVSLAAGYMALTGDVRVDYEVSVNATGGKH